MMIMKPDEIREIRKEVLGLSQTRAAELFGGGLKAFSYYEHGQKSPSISLQQLFLILKKHPSLVSVLVETGINYSNKRDLNV